MDDKMISNDMKKNKKIGLGRGLEALIPGKNILEESNNNGLIECDIDRIRQNPYQPRMKFSEQELQELADSIRDQGILQPLIVRESGDGYELAAGERRLKAAKLAGLTRVPVIVKSISDFDLLKISIVENVQREDLNAIEESNAYHRLMTEFQMTQEQVADCVGKNRSTVANMIRIRELPSQIRESIANNEISKGHAKALLGGENETIQLEAWRYVVSKGLNVRQTEALVRKLNKLKNKKQPTPTLFDSEKNYLLNLSDQLTKYLGTKVQIKRRGKKGKIEIEFYSDDDLNRLLERIKADGFN